MASPSNRPGGPVICPPCRDRLHGQCPEITRQMDATLSDTDRQGSKWCDCQHCPPGDPRA